MKKLETILNERKFNLHEKAAEQLDIDSGEGCVRFDYEFSEDIENLGDCDITLECYAEVRRGKFNNYIDVDFTIKSIVAENGEIDLKTLKAA